MAGFLTPGGRKPTSHPSKPMCPGVLVGSTSPTLGAKRNSLSDMLSKKLDWSQAHKEDPSASQTTLEPSVVQNPGKNRDCDRKGPSTQ